MTDCSVSIGCVIANTLWGAVALLILASWWTDDPTIATRLGQTGLALSAAAATATIRGYFVKHNRLVEVAWEGGRQSVRSVR